MHSLQSWGKVGALGTLVRVLVQITMVRGGMAEAHGFKVGAGLWQTGSPVPSCLGTSVIGRGRRMWGMQGRLEREKNVSMEHTLACFFQRYCQRLVHFPNKQTSLTVMLTGYTPLFSPPALNIFNTWAKKYHLASRCVACMPFNLLMPEGFFLFFLRKTEK